MPGPHQSLSPCCPSSLWGLPVLTRLWDCLTESWFLSCPFPFPANQVLIINCLSRKYLKWNSDWDSLVGKVLVQCLFFFNWNILSLQYYISFKCRAKWFSDTYVHTHTHTQHIYIHTNTYTFGISWVAHLVKNPPAMWETPVWLLGQE